MAENKLKPMLETFDSFKYYLDDKLNRDIEENRKGQFVIRFKESGGKPLKNMRVKVKQKSHEFKFGCSLFHLDQFPDDERNNLYKESFKNLFNYAVVPFYWNTLEPEEGKPRFSKDSSFISRRPPIDTIMEFCRENNIQTKGHCLAYNAFQPDWLPEDNRQIKIKLENRVRAIAERYGDSIPDFDVINEMFSIYKNCYKGNSVRNLQITDLKDYEKWSFNTCRKYFPNARLFWNEGLEESIGIHYRGNRSFYYMTLEKMLSQGVGIDGIGMQYHVFEPEASSLNPLRIIDVFDCYSEFGLPIHISEITIPSFSNDEADEQIQAEITKRLFMLWFGRKNCEAVVWWNLVDKTAFGGENDYYGGLLRNDCSKKAAYLEIEKLIKQEWNTAFVCEVFDQLRFSGFYGDYELEITHNGKTVTKELTLHRCNTGYDNRLCDFRAKEIIL